MYSLTLRDDTQKALDRLAFGTTEEGFGLMRSKDQEGYYLGVDNVRTQNGLRIMESEEELGVQLEGTTTLLNAIGVETKEHWSRDEHDMRRTRDVRIGEGSTVRCHFSNEDEYLLHPEYLKRALDAGDPKTLATLINDASKKMPWPQIDVDNVPIFEKEIRRDAERFIVLADEIDSYDPELKQQSTDNCVDASVALIGQALECDEGRRNRIDDTVLDGMSPQAKCSAAAIALSALCVGYAQTLGNKSPMDSVKNRRCYSSVAAFDQSAAQDLEQNGTISPTRTAPATHIVGWACRNEAFTLSDQRGDYQNLAKRFMEIMRAGGLALATQSNVHNEGCVEGNVWTLLCDAMIYEAPNYVAVDAHLEDEDAMGMRDAANNLQGMAPAQGVLRDFAINTGATQSLYEMDYVTRFYVGRLIERRLKFEQDNEESLDNSIAAGLMLNARAKSLAPPSVAETQKDVRERAARSLMHVIARHTHNNDTWISRQHSRLLFKDLESIGQMDADDSAAFLDVLNSLSRPNLCTQITRNSSVNKLLAIMKPRPDQQRNLTGLRLRLEQETRRTVLPEETNEIQQARASIMSAHARLEAEQGEWRDFDATDDTEQNLGAPTL